MNLQTLVVSLVAGGLLALPLSAGEDYHAGKEGKDGAWKGGEMHSMWKDLNLTQQQKDQLKAAHQEMQTQRQELFQKMKGLRKTIKDEIMKDNPDQNMLNNLAEQSGALEKEAALLRFQHFLKMKSILTKEQFEKILDNDRPGLGMEEGMEGPGGPHGEGMHKGDKDAKTGCPMKKEKEE
jgi:Spy/CpxP family protein refolding chaperone